MSIVKFTLQEGMSGSSTLVLNTFYYETPSTIDTIAVLNGVLATWILNVLPEIRAIQTTEVDVEKVSAEVIDSALFAETSFVLTTGNLAPPTEPQFVAVPFRLVRSTLATRHGQKRFMGVPEGNVDRNGGIFGGTYLTALQNAADAMEEPIPVAGGSDLLPVIFRAADPAHDPPFVQTTNPVLEVVAPTRVTTQNTRKEGRGA